MAGRVALGLDIGNASIKLCLAAPDRLVGHTSVPVPYRNPGSYDRAPDFAEGIPAALSAFLADRPAPAVVVAVTSNGYSHPSFADGVRATFATLAGCLPDARVLALDGRAGLVPSERIADEPSDDLGPVAISNGMGAVRLARHVLPARGTTLVVDNGGSTAAGTLLRDGRVVPADVPDAAWTDGRTRTGRLTWMGLRTTPLEALASEVPVGSRVYPVIPRGVPFECVSVVLGLLPDRIARQRALFGLGPSMDVARRGLADALGVDRTSLSDAELDGVAQVLLDRALDRLAAGFRTLLQEAPEGVDRAVLFGLSTRSLTRPALVRAGVPADRILLAEDRFGELAAREASSFGACLAGLTELGAALDDVPWLRPAAP